MCGNEHELKNIQLTIELPGIPETSRRMAEEDIRKLADSIRAAAKGQDLPFRLRLVRVTDNFQGDVNQLFDGRSSHSGYVAKRESAQAIGKTLWTYFQHGDLGFAIILDSNTIGPWGLNNAKCLTTLLHELIHVLHEERHIERLGEEEYTKEPDSRERWLNGWATMLLDEFDVDRDVDKLVKVLASKDDGEPWSLRELDEAEGLNWVDGFKNELEQMPKAVDEKVWCFRTRRLGIDDLAIEVIPRVKDALRLLSHTASRYMDTEDWPMILERIRETEASQRFFKEHIDTILAQLHDDRAPFEESVQIIAQAVEKIFHNCGLSFETVPEGVYISVTAPAR